MGLNFLNQNVRKKSKKPIKSNFFNVIGVMFLRVKTEDKGSVSTKIQTLEAAEIGEISEER